MIAEKGAQLVELETGGDRVHLPVEVGPEFEIHDLVKAIKGHSSRTRISWPTSAKAALSVTKRYVKTKRAAD